MVNHRILHWYRVGYRIWDTNTQCTVEGTEQGTRNKEHRNGTQNDRNPPFHGTEVVNSTSPHRQ